jgi:catechol 2,3-dioxygenase-like lactoylglutathione lyase family enzyme
MIDHIYLPVADVGRSRTFYRALLSPLGIEESFTRGDSVVFGMGQDGALWIYPSVGRAGPDEDPCGMDPAVTGSLPHLHIAFRAETRAQVQRFFDVGVDLGAEVMHPPGMFPQYHPTYFAAFVRDPDGHNIEAVCSAPDPQDEHA